MFLLGQKAWVHIKVRKIMMVEELKYAQMLTFGVESGVDGEPLELEDEEDEDDDEEDEEEDEEDASDNLES